MASVGGFDLSGVTAGQVTVVPNPGVIVVSNLSVDQAIWIEFRALAFNQPLQIRAIVRHASLGRYGVQFQSPSRDHLHHIQQLIGSA